MLEDACWHRLLPLSKGSLSGDTVVCGYHGLEYKSDGRCSYMPSQETINPSACVRSYPVIQKYRFIWVWMGNPALADEKLIPDMHWNDDPEWAGDGQMIKVHCNYRLVVDNLMDLTHETFVHSESIGDRNVAEAPFDVHYDEKTATVTRWMKGIQLLLLIMGLVMNQFAKFLGNIAPQGKLPFELPSSMEAVKNQKTDVPYDSENPLFKFGFGLTY